MLYVWVSPIHALRNRDHRNSARSRNSVVPFLGIEPLGGDVMAGIVVLVVAGLALVVGVVWLMAQLDRRSSREFQRRRDAWEAAGGVGPSPGEGLRGGGSGNVVS
jgi:hypothetical protein